MTEFRQAMEGFERTEGIPKREYYRRSNGKWDGIIQEFLDAGIEFAAKEFDEPKGECMKWYTNLMNAKGKFDGVKVVKRGNRVYLVNTKMSNGGDNGR